MKISPFVRHGNQIYILHIAFAFSFHCKFFVCPLKKEQKLSLIHGIGEGFIGFKRTNRHIMDHEKNKKKFLIKNDYKYEIHADIW